MGFRCIQVGLIAGFHAQDEQSHTASRLLNCGKRSEGSKIVAEVVLHDNREDSFHLLLHVPMHGSSPLPLICIIRKHHQQSTPLIHLTTTRADNNPSAAPTSTAP